MAATISTSQLLSLTGLMVDILVDRNNKTVWADRVKRPLYYYLESIRKPTALSGDGVDFIMKFAASNLSLTTWAGDVTLPNAGSINNHVKWRAKYANFFMAFSVVFDFYKQLGFTIVPNDSTQDPNSLIKPMSGQEYSQLKSKLLEDLDSLADQWERLMDMAHHRQGTLSTDLVGLNGLLPASPKGLIGGFDRTRNPLFQHIIAAGSGAGLPAGTKHLFGSLTTGTSGNACQNLETIFTRLRANAAGSELPSGGWKIFGGMGALNKIKDSYFKQRNVQFQSAAGRKSRGKVDMLLMDDDIQVAGMDFIWDPTIDDMDGVAASERPVGMSPGIVTFSGGGGSGAAAALIVNTAGAVDSIVLTERGSGYTTQPTAAISGAGGGTGATLKVWWHKVTASPSGAAGEIGVDADDSRAGTIAYVEVTAAGSGYTAGTLLNFTDMAWILYEPALCPLYQEGLNKNISVPPQSARNRKAEIQCDATHIFGLRAFRVNAVIHLA
jgi:hypothetical protein